MKRVFELKIDEDDDISGIQYISIVKNPATELEYEVFSDETPHICYKEEDFSDEALSILDQFGSPISPEMLVELEINDVDITMTEQEFAAPPIIANPRQPSFGDDDSDAATSISRYIYVIDTGVGAPLMRTSREMCRKMILAQKVFSRTDLQNMSNALTSAGDTFKLIPRAKVNSQVDFFTYKSGNRCRHAWKQIDFPIKLNQTYEETLSKIPLKSQAALGKGQVIEQSDRPFVSEARYLNRLPTKMSIENQLKPIGFHMGLFVYPTRFSALVAEPLAKTISKVKLGIMEGYCPVDITDEYFEGTGDVLERFKVRETFVIPTKEIQETAQRVLDWTEENGWGDCGTAVGKTRANQLAKGDNLSIETITRMYSYLSRHKVDLESSKSYEMGCGRLMYDSWGGEAALSWAEKEMKKAVEMNIKFSSDEFRGDITAVVFEPDTHIYRYDTETMSPYYVFMSKETIRKMLMKISRLKPKNLINLEHSGMVFSGDDVYTYENWIVGDNPLMDKSYEIFGREMKPGTWITTIHFRDKRLFDEFILSNKTSGISLEGLFEEVPFNFFDIKKEDFIEPKPGQSKEDYIAECIPYAIKEGKTQDEAAGMCYGMWDNKFVDIEEEDMMEKNAEELVKMLEELLKEMDKSL
jgi:hypothetical protein